MARKRITRMKTCPKWTVSAAIAVALGAATAFGQSDPAPAVPQPPADCSLHAVEGYRVGMSRAQALTVREAKPGPDGSLRVDDRRTIRATIRFDAADRLSEVEEILSDAPADLRKGLMERLGAPSQKSSSSKIPREEPAPRAHDLAGYRLRPVGGIAGELRLAATARSYASPGSRPRHRPSAGNVYEPMPKPAPKFDSESFASPGNGPPMPGLMGEPPGATSTATSSSGRRTSRSAVSAPAAHPRRGLRQRLSVAKLARRAARPRHRYAPA